MGVEVFPSHWEEMIENILTHTEEQDGYIVKIDAFRNKWDEHMPYLDHISPHIKANEFDTKSRLSRKQIG